MSKYWCPKCRMALPGEERLTMLRLKAPPYYHFAYLPYCHCGEVMRGLCVDCQKAPSQDGLDQCLKCWPPGSDAPLSEYRRGISDEEFRKQVSLSVSPDVFRAACLAKKIV